MADTPHGEPPVRIIGEQRLHPALRKLGRACIALVRWQREQQQKLAEPTTDETALTPGSGDQAVTEASAAPEPGASS